MAHVGLRALPGGSDHRDVNALIAHMVGVKKAVGVEGAAIAARAKSELAAHRDTGAARIEVTRQDTDSLISLVDPAALSIEYGRAAGPDGKGAMQGLHILSRAANL